MNNAKNKRLALGFTLIELLITITVIGILTSIAIPSYQNYMTKARRSDAQQLIMLIANRQEQYLLDARAYTTTIGAGGLNVAQTGWTCTATTCSNNFYSVTAAIDAGPPPTYTVTATATGPQTSDGNLSLTSAGVRSRSAGDGKW